MKTIKIKSLAQAGVVSLHSILPIALVVVAVGGVGAYVLQKSKADSPFKCMVAPAIASGNTEWYPVVIKNQSGKPTTSLSEFSFQGISANTGSKPFTWTWPANKDMIQWMSGFSGTSLPSNGMGTVDIRKPVTPSNVKQSGWTLVVTNSEGKAYYKCATTTSIYTAYTDLSQVPNILPSAPMTDLAISNVNVTKVPIDGTAGTAILTLKNRGADFAPAGAYYVQVEESPTGDEGTYTTKYAVFKNTPGLKVGEEKAVPVPMPNYTKANKSVYVRFVVLHDNEVNIITRSLNEVINLNTGAVTPGL